MVFNRNLYLKGKHLVSILMNLVRMLLVLNFNIVYLENFFILQKKKIAFLERKKREA